MRATDFFDPSVEDYIVRIRRELHQHPELGFDLPFTTDLVKTQLTAMGVPYTEQYGKSGIVAMLGKTNSRPCVAIRADMDALPITENSAVSFPSLEPGKMHACGHDAHTAILLGTARALKRAETQLKGSVKLIFQPNEEGGGGAIPMIEDGVLNDVDVIVALHTDNKLECGTIGAREGAALAASTPISLEFFGKTAHAAVPEKGHDALAMAVKTYNGIQTMLLREIDPLVRYACSITVLKAGTAPNVVPDYAQMEIALRTFDLQLSEFIHQRIQMIAEHAAQELGGTARWKCETNCLPLINNPDMTRKLLCAAAKIVGDDHIVPVDLGLGSEDYSYFLDKVPGVYFRLGTKNAAKGCVARAHNSDFCIDEAAMILGSKTYVQFVLDYFDQL